MIDKATPLKVDRAYWLQSTNRTYIELKGDALDRAEVAVNHFDEVVAALEQIAAFTDEGASEHLERTGSYSSFDEPGSVEVARKVLAAVKVNGKN